MTFFHQNKKMKFQKIIFKSSRTTVLKCVFVRSLNVTSELNRAESGGGKSFLFSQHSLLLTKPFFFSMTSNMTSLNKNYIAKLIFNA